MAVAQLIITAVTLEGRTKSEVARDCGVSRYWVQQLVSRYQREGPAAFQPRSRRPHHSPHAVSADTEDLIIRLRKELSKQGFDAGAETIAAHLTRQAPDDGGRLAVPAVSTIWRILGRRGFVRPQPQKTAAVVVANVLRRPAQRTLAGRYNPLAAGRGTEVGILNIIDDHSRLQMDVGRVPKFAIVKGPPPIPSGVLCQGELDNTPLGLSIFAAVSRGELHSLSLGGDGRPEISLTARPAYTNCKIIGWGDHARSSWEVHFAEVYGASVSEETVS
jgi:hypothetical protein